MTGISLTAATVDGVQNTDLAKLLLQTIMIGFFPTVIVTLAALSIFRRWIAGHEERNRRDLAAMAEQRRKLSVEFDRRSAELHEREERLNRHSNLNDGQIRMLMDQGREARAERDQAIRQRDQLRTDFDALAAEYNGLVLGEVDERAAQFTRPRSPRPGSNRDHRRERGATGPPSVPYIGRQTEPEPEHHALPAEG
ncbi:hypothetical protein ACFV27_00550 [Streptomyces antimycoticus]|uniref:hypothetical protein n=1 Tax=Streptomyces antimycoticus TaxID=68175 RepID=UPI0036AF9EC6